MSTAPSLDITPDRRADADRSASGAGVPLSPAEALVAQLEDQLRTAKAVRAPQRSQTPDAAHCLSRMIPRLIFRRCAGTRGLQSNFIGLTEVAV